VPKHGKVTTVVQLAADSVTTGPIGGPPPFAAADAVAEASEFLEMCRREMRPASVARGRIDEIADEFRRTGTYRHTPDELWYGARLAWRNSLDCLGKSAWQQLVVHDRRDITTPDDTFEGCVEHLQAATNGGRVRALLTAFAPAGADGRGIRIWNSQLVCYAGYQSADGSVVGDGAMVRFTDAVRALGWHGAGTPYDVLPIVIQAPGREPRWYPVPADAVVEVDITHPDLPWFPSLGLRWYAHPAISNQLLRIGGVSYPAAPFSGWYSCSEVALRNLAEASRYDALPAIATRMGLDMSSHRTLWRDRALVELMRAVVHSFDQQGVTIIDHHLVTAAFLRHERRETAAGRPTRARWSSLVMATGAVTHSVLPRHYVDEFVLPNFWPQPVLGNDNG
jgi:nitric-oxide synthase, bacterial